MLNKIYVNNCLGLSNFEILFSSSHSIVKENKNDVIKALLNIYNGSDENNIINENEIAEIILYFNLNNTQIDYISSFLLLDSSNLVVYKSILKDKITYFINEKEVNFTTIKKVLNYLIDNRRILNKILNDFDNLIENYILKNDETYSLNKYNYLKLNELQKEYEEELNIIENNNNNESIQDLINIKNEIEDFDLEKGEISYISKMYESLKEEKSNKETLNKVISSFNEALNIMKENMPYLEQLENEEELKEEVISLEQSFFNLKENLDSLKNCSINDKNSNNEYIINRYNNIQEFKNKYGNTYKEINEYYNNVISKINYYKYKKINKQNIIEKINNILNQSSKIKNYLDNIKKNYIYKIVNYFNNLCYLFDNRITLSIIEDNININIDSKSVSFDEIKEYSNYNLITFLLNTIFLKESDKTIIVDDDFSYKFNKEQMFNYINLLNSLNNCLVLSDNENYI